MTDPDTTWQARRVKYAGGRAAGQAYERWKPASLGRLIVHVGGQAARLAYGRRMPAGPGGCRPGRSR